jgi:hypothetical protein
MSAHFEAFTFACSTPFHWEFNQCTDLPGSAWTREKFALLVMHPVIKWCNWSARVKGEV